MLKYLPKQQSSQRAIFSFLLFSSLFFLGCAVLDPHEVGQGQYYQVKNSNGKVIVENNSAGSGFINCPNTATQQINSNPVLKGRIQCATSPSTDTLPYTIKLIRIKQPNKVMLEFSNQLLHIAFVMLSKPHACKP
jgi:hypothetical protein